MSTFRDKFGRRDPDLTPRHDAIMWWLDEQLRQGKITPTPAAEVPISIEWESIVPADTDRGQFPVAFVDIMATYKINAEPFRVGFEVKPLIYSIGELLRQLKTYQNLDRTVAKWIVVSPPNELAEKAIRREGFGWLDVPESLA